MEEYDFPKKLQVQHEKNGHNGKINLCKICIKILENLLSRENNIPVIVRIIPIKLYSQLN